MNSKPPQAVPSAAPIRSPEKEEYDFLRHPLFDRSQQRLREIVDVSLLSHDGMPILSVLLARVPMIGEHVEVEGRLYRVIDVQHATLDLDGRAALGTHAYLTVVEVPDPGLLQSPRLPPDLLKSRKTRRGRRSKGRKPRGD